MNDDTQEGGRRYGEKAPYNDTEIVIPPAYLLTHTMYYLLRVATELPLYCVITVPVHTDQVNLLPHNASHSSRWPANGTAGV